MSYKAFYRGFMEKMSQGLDAFSYLQGMMAPPEEAEKGEIEMSDNLVDDSEKHGIEESQPINPPSEVAGQSMPEEDPALIRNYLQTYLGQ